MATEKRAQNCFFFTLLAPVPRSILVQTPRFENNDGEMLDTITGIIINGPELD